MTTQTKLFWTEEDCKRYGLKLPQPKFKIGDNVTTFHGKGIVLEILPYPLLQYVIDVEGCGVMDIGFEEFR